MTTLRSLAAVVLRRFASFGIMLATASKQAYVRRTAIIIGLILSIHPQAFGQIHYVQSTNGVSQVSASSVSASFASTTAGNTIIVAVAAAGPAISSVGDSQGNGYAQAVVSGSNAIWYAAGIKGGADTVTANFASSTGFSLIYIHEYSGLAASPLDQVSSQTGNGTAITSGAKTTTQAAELIFGYASVDYSVAASGTGFTARQIAGGNMSEDMVTTVSGSYAATFTQSKSGNWTALMATFKAPTSSGSQILAINAGGPAVSPFVADEDFSGGTTYSNTNTINTGNVTNPAPPAVYQSQRYGNFTYTIPGLTTSTSYLVRLHFAEIYWGSVASGGVGSRLFNVTINGTQVLSNFDVFKDSGGANIADIQQFTETPNSSGQIVIQFTTVTNNAFVSGIEIDAVGPCTAPTAPSSLSAAAASSTQINVTWTSSTSSCGGITYNIYRSTTNGFTPSSASLLPSGTGVTGKSYTDTYELAPSTTYYYLVEATNLGGTSPQSNQAQATTPAGPSPSGIAIDSGSTTPVGSFLADEDYSGGSPYTEPNTINTSNVTDPAPAAVYQTHRFGNFTYTIPNLTPGETYLVRLHFCEVFWTAAGDRVFNVSINGTQVLTDFDVFKDSGGQNIADIKQFAVTVPSSGTYASAISVQFITVTNNAFVSGIEIIPISTALAIDTGSTTAVSNFVADECYSGGTTIDHANTINTSDVPDAAPAAVYQTARTDNFTYTVPCAAPYLTNSDYYLIRLHFAETYWTAAGDREFNVSINGTQVLTDFDIFKAAGGQNIAVIEQFLMQPNSSGQFIIQFTSVIDNSLISGIEIDSLTTIPDFSISASPAAQIVTPGAKPTYTVTVSPLNGFTGTVSLSVSGQPSVDTPTFSPTTITGGSGSSTLTVATSSSLAYSDSTLTLTGTSGSLSHSTSVTLAVGSEANLVIQLASSLTNVATELHGVEASNPQPGDLQCVSGGASSNDCVPGISSPAVPSLNITDGPAGVTHNGPGHGEDSNSNLLPSTALPAPILLAATWDPTMANRFGTALGAEAAAYGNGLVNGPDINIARNLQNGRTFESFGEDPYLSGQIAVGEIQGIQAQNVIAESKHFVANNQETDRMVVNENINERTLRELYLPAFETTVTQGNVGAIMCAYNQVMDPVNTPPLYQGYMCSNGYLLNSILKQQWGFFGFVVSDYRATRAIPVANAVSGGLDLEMPYGLDFLASNLQPALSSGAISTNSLEDKLMRRLQTMALFNVFQNPPSTAPGPNPTLASTDDATAKAVAEAGIVLLQNKIPANGTSRLLPLNALLKAGFFTKKNIAVVGPYGGAAMTGGGGSSTVMNFLVSPVSPVTGIQNWLSNNGYTGFTVTYTPGTNYSTVQANVQAADIAIVTVGNTEFEGWDLVPYSANSSCDSSISLSGTHITPPLTDAYTCANDSISSVDQNDLITKVLGWQANTIVVVKSGTGVLMPFANSSPAAPAILEAWYPGQEDGNAVADILFGTTNPSGKLPLTFPVNASDPLPPADNSNPAEFPGQTSSGATCTRDQFESVPYNTSLDSNCTVTYSEGLLTGYRHYDANNITPQFPFGFGLSYTTFSFSNLNITPSSFTFTGDPNQTVTVTFNVTNTGSVAGAEVAQLYVAMPAGNGEPPKWLKGFQKISLNPGQTTSPEVTLTLNFRSFAYWDVTSETWKVAPGTYTIMVGDSSRNTLLTQPVTIN